MLRTTASLLSPYTIIDYAKVHVVHVPCFIHGAVILNCFLDVIDLSYENHRLMMQIFALNLSTQNAGSPCSSLYAILI